MSAASDQPHILLFFSDQHDGRLAGFAGHDLLQTPNLDRIAAAGTACDAAVTACPLCVPARSAMLTGQLPSRTGIYSNEGSIRTDQPTFLHNLAAAGYETVLCGRMHFVGPDQRHGFGKRIFGDVTAMYAGGLIRHKDEVFRGTFGMGNPVGLVGVGTSPVLEYDRCVIEAALQYLRQDHDRPQCIVVGLYGPHFPYVAPPDMYDLYAGRVSVPASWRPEQPEENPFFHRKRQTRRHNNITGQDEPVTERLMLAARAAYFGMVSQVDRQVGQVRQAWDDYLRRSGRPGLFVYASDHGDTCGEHGIFGKQTFYEGSVRIPIVFEGCGVQAGQRLTGATSILDVGPTLCAFGGAEPTHDCQGEDLRDQLVGQAGDDEDRAVRSDWLHWQDGRPVPGRMCQRGRWKLIRFASPDVPDQLFDLADDPDELDNRDESEPEVFASMTAALQDDWDPNAISRRAIELREQIRMVHHAWRVQDLDATVPPSERWDATPESLAAPDRIAEA